MREPFDSPERRNNKFNRRRIETLQRRHDFLSTRKGSVGSESYDEAEYQALGWAIRALKQWMKDDPHWVFVPSRNGNRGRWVPRKEAASVLKGIKRFLVQRRAA